MKNSLIAEKTYRFAKEIVFVYRELVARNEFILSKQLLRSGTSIGANIAEASAAESKKDFIHKMSIASKEARETKYWLNLLSDTQLVNYDYEVLMDEIKQIIKMLNAIIKTTTERLH